jgi:hypothetical protein
MITDTVGVNSANNLTLALMAHRDPETLAWSDTPLIEPPPQTPLPVSVPPWWNMGKKHAMFYNGEGRGDHVRYMILASTTCTDSVEEAAEIDAWFVDVRAYLASLQPPKYPFAIDRGPRGTRYTVFRHLQGVSRHLRRDAAYPNRVIALGKVKTDPGARAQGFQRCGPLHRVVRSDPFTASSLRPPRRSAISHRRSTGSGRPRPICTTARCRRLRPCSTAARARPIGGSIGKAMTGPRMMRRHSAGPIGSWINGKAGAMSWDERNHIYDTSLPGYGNQGHTFGDDLSESERLALIEYLKTL